MMTPKKKLFAQEYLVDLNATQAATRAGYSPHTAKSQGQRLLTDVDVQQAIMAAQQKRAERTEITQDMVLKRWWAIATANPNEIMQWRRVACRHCHGADHGYQWVDEAEFQHAVAMAIQNAPEGKGPVLPSNAGGYGFNPILPPAPDCPSCHGEGHGQPHFNDTRNLPPAAALLYAGVKVSKEGIEIKTQDQSKALENVARHLGMFNDKLDLTSGGKEIKSGVLVVPGVISEKEWEEQSS